MKRQVKSTAPIEKAKTGVLCYQGRQKFLGLKPPRKEKSCSSSGVTNNAALMIRLRSQEESKYTVGQRHSHDPGKSGNSGKLHLRKG